MAAVHDDDRARAAAIGRVDQLAALTDILNDALGSARFLG